MEVFIKRRRGRGRCGRWLSDAMLWRQNEEEKKKKIYTKLLETKKLSKRDLRFMKKIDWHPLDEIDLTKEAEVEIKKLLYALKESKCEKKIKSKIQAKSKDRNKKIKNKKGKKTK